MSLSLLIMLIILAGDHDSTSVRPRHRTERRDPVFTGGRRWGHFWRLPGQRIHLSQRSSYRGMSYILNVWDKQKTKQLATKRKVASIVAKK
jgi:hypothetical protein